MAVVGIVWIVNPKDFSEAFHFVRNSVKVNIEIVFSQNRRVVGRRAGKHVSNVVGRIAWTRCDADVAWIENAQCHFNDSVFTTGVLSQPVHRTVGPCNGAGKSRGLLVENRQRGDRTRSGVCLSHRGFGSRYIRFQQLGLALEISGSPMPRLITSTPRACAACIF